jgi:hypothetical protein
MPRQNGNSLFVDDNIRPFPDQWQLLASARRVTADQVEWIVNDAARTGQIVAVRMSIADDESDGKPWTLPPSKKRGDREIQGPFPEHVEMVQGNLVYIPKVGLPEQMLSRLLCLAAFFRIRSFTRPRRCVFQRGTNRE